MNERVLFRNGGLIVTNLRVIGRNYRGEVSIPLAEVASVGVTSEALISLLPGKRWWVTVTSPSRSGRVRISVGKRGKGKRAAAAASAAIHQAIAGVHAN